MARGFPLYLGCYSSDGIDFPHFNHSTLSLSLFPLAALSEFPSSECLEFRKIEIALSRLNKSPATLYYAIEPP